MAKKTNKTSRRAPSIDPNEKRIIRHCRLNDVPSNRNLIGVSSEADPNTVVFEIGSQNDTSVEFVYASFEEATNYGTFSKYLHKYLIPCEGRPWGNNGVTHIYRGKYDYTILPKDENGNVAGKEHPDGISHKTPMQVQITQIKDHEVEETPILPSVSKENVAEEVNLQDSSAGYVKSVIGKFDGFASKRQRMVLEPIEETPERSMFTRSEPISAPNYSHTPSLNAEGRDQQPNNDIIPTHSRSTPENSTELDPDSPGLSACCSPINDSAELEHQQRQLEKITTFWRSPVTTIIDNYNGPESDAEASNENDPVDEKMSHPQRDRPRQANKRPPSMMKTITSSDATNSATNGISNGSATTNLPVKESPPIVTYKPAIIPANNNKKTEITPTKEPKSSFKVTHTDLTPKSSSIENDTTTTASSSAHTYSPMPIVSEDEPYGKLYNQMAKTFNEMLKDFNNLKQDVVSLKQEVQQLRNQ